LSNGSEFSAPGAAAVSGGTNPPVSPQPGAQIPKGWHKPLPERLPKPGYWPAIMAMGVTFMLWGMAVGFNEVVSTIIILFFVGLSLFIVALIGWIGDLRDERKDQNE
jgi:hypothetical protein